MNRAGAVRPEGHGLECCGLVGAAATQIGSLSLTVLALTGTWIAGSVLLARAKMPSQTLKGTIMLGVGLPLSVAVLVGTGFHTRAWKRAAASDSNTPLF
jgi:hypothetical protein